ncbi:hypothetical protein DN752_22050 [Echinicola strongylocentroti]|uniref:Uncharacterized protein n=1 Tax=Echinicola strongylocentroti TaxID=1795355 RepID=A0A2Z4IQN0_9BACT|nr:hypothetical protein [Echinicola strongylocentroti]AWW32613.1 hypothetical protein DN752_22050 [Echinicola strongylocentroti]
MVNNLLQIEKISQKILRIVMAAYWAAASCYAIFGTEAPYLVFSGRLSWSIPSMLTALLLIAHFKSPRLGIAGGGLSALIFIAVTIYCIKALPFNLTIILNYLLLVISSVILLGESIKEMVRERITQPFPKA